MNSYFNLPLYSSSIHQSPLLNQQSPSTPSCLFTNDSRIQNLQINPHQASHLSFSQSQNINASSPSNELSLLLQGINNQNNPLSNCNNLTAIDLLQQSAPTLSSAMNLNKLSENLQLFPSNLVISQNNQSDKLIPSFLSHSTMNQIQQDNFQRSQITQILESKYQQQAQQQQQQQYQQLQLNLLNELSLRQKQIDFSELQFKLSQVNLIETQIKCLQQELLKSCSQIQPSTSQIGFQSEYALPQAQLQFHKQSSLQNISQNNQFFTPQSQFNQIQSPTYNQYHHQQSPSFSSIKNQNNYYLQGAENYQNHYQQQPSYATVPLVDNLLQETVNQFTSENIKFTSMNGQQQCPNELSSTIIKDQDSSSTYEKPQAQIIYKKCEEEQTKEDNINNANNNYYTQEQLHSNEKKSVKSLNKKRQSCQSPSQEVLPSKKINCEINKQLKLEEPKQQQYQPQQQQQQQLQQEQIIKERSAYSKRNSESVVDNQSLQKQQSSQSTSQLKDEYLVQPENEEDSNERAEAERKKEIQNESNYTKNILKGFRRYFTKNHHSNKRLSNNFEKYFSINSLNNEFVLKLLTFSPYSSQFKEFLEEDPTWWMEEARIVNKERQREVFEMYKTSDISLIKTKRKSVNQKILTKLANKQKQPNSNIKNLINQADENNQIEAVSYNHDKSNEINIQKGDSQNVADSAKDIEKYSYAPSIQQEFDISQENKSTTNNEEEYKKSDQDMNSTQFISFEQKDEQLLLNEPEERRNFSFDTFKFLPYEQLSC